MNELIEKLKDNEAHKIFADFPEIEQEILNKSKPLGLVQCLNDNLEWITAKHYNDSCFNIGIYRIDPAYQPEPEYVDLEIVKHTEVSNEPFWWLGVWKNADGKRYDFLPFEFTHLHCLPSLPGFVGFTEEDMLGCLVIEKVASKISEGHKVFARFKTHG